jgi:Histidine kinase
VRTHRSAYAFARGALIGVFTMLTPSERKTSSKGQGNFESWSRITNRIPRSRSREIAGLLSHPNLHDGAQQQIVALTVKLRLLGQLMDRDVEKAKSMASDLQAVAARQDRS